MERTFRFYKTEEQKWYVDLPEWTKMIADLEMVEGADQMLDIASGHTNECYLKMSNESFEGADVIKLVTDRSDRVLGGGDYIMEACKGKVINQKLWLCTVTVDVFGNLPKEIFVGYPTSIDH